jgi:hypothetical protein
MPVEELLEKIDRLRASGNRKDLTSLLRHLLERRRFYYGESVRQEVQDGLSDALMKALLLELDEEEEEGIEAAELSYAGIGSALSLRQDDPSRVAELYKQRLLLLHYFGDNLTDAVITLFLEKYRTSHLLEARNLALACMEKMRIYDRMWLEEYFPGFIDTDEQLSDACDAFETDGDLSEEELKEAETLHRVLHAFLKSKYKG